MTSPVPERIGRYQVLGLLGQGAMGTVYRGRDETLERDVALKVMSTVGQADADARARFLREARAAARLQHPNIVIIYELGEHEGAPFMALELLEGTDLQRAIEAGLRPDPKVTLPIVLQALLGLGAAHEHGIVHRDVKPSNVFLPRGRPAKLMDFGVARLAGGGTTAGLVVGTPNYMSPEQVKAAEVDGRSDLFSMGLILYELVTGEKAYRGDTVVTLLYKIINEDPDLRLIPKGPQWERLQRVLARALAKRPDDRYPDSQTMAAELADALKDLGGSPDWATRSDQGLVHARRRSPSESHPVLTPTPAPAPRTLPVESTTPMPSVRVDEPERGPAAPAREPGTRLPLALAAALGVAAVALLVVAVLLVMRRGQPARGSSAGTVAVGAVPSTTIAPAPVSRAAAPIATPATSTPATSSPAPSSTTLAAAPPRMASNPPPTPPETQPRGPSPAEARLDRANDYMEKQRYAQALAEVRAVLARDPNNAEARALAGDAEAAILIEDCVKKARAALKAGDRDLALEEIRRGLQVNPSEGRLLALHREATQ